MTLHSFIQRPTFGDTTTGFPTKWCLRNKRRNSILMTPHYPDLGSASDWLSQISNVTRPIRCTTQIWVVTRHQYGIFALVSQTSFHEETSGGVAKCQLFSQASLFLPVDVFFRCTFFIQSLVFQWNCRISEIVCWVPPLESSSNQDDNKGNEKIKKTTGLISKIKTLNISHFLADSFAIIAPLTLSNLIGIAFWSSLQYWRSLFHQ